MKNKLSEYHKQNSYNIFQKYLANLTLFIKENGQFPTRLQDVKLYQWVDKQKNNYHTGILSNERFNQLDLLGLNWENTDKEWLAKSSELMTYLSTQKKIPPRNNSSKLLSWLTIQRIRLNKGNLSDSQKNIINEIVLIVKGIQLSEKANSKFEIIEKEKDFQDKLALLIAFRVEHPNSWPENKNVDAEEIKLSQWCRKQQRRFRKNILSNQYLST